MSVVGTSRDMSGKVKAGFIFRKVSVTMWWWWNTAKTLDCFTKNEWGGCTIYKALMYIQQEKEPANLERSCHSSGARIVGCWVMGHAGSLVHSWSLQGSRAHRSLYWFILWSLLSSQYIFNFHTVTADQALQCERMWRFILVWGLLGCFLYPMNILGANNPFELHMPCLHGSAVCLS